MVTPQLLMVYLSTHFQVSVTLRKAHLPSRQIDNSGQRSEFITSREPSGGSGRRNGSRQLAYVPDAEIQQLALDRS